METLTLKITILKSNKIDFILDTVEVGVIRVGHNVPIGREKNG